jgi:D-alanyl-D-alanine carboxypeptidase/D-alanyl-D-alanine-endopeptidase (penicillin-binding protein 4)
MRWRIGLVFFALLAACSPAKRLGLEKALRNTSSNFQEHTGFMLYDMEKKTSVYEYNSDRYFTPASNTKIFTLYTALRILGDSVPALKYAESGDSLIFWGTGDPSFLYRYTFNNGRVYDFLSRSDKQLYFSSSNFFTTHFGPGWAWDDYNDYYAAERSPFPVYGNIMTLRRDGQKFSLTPSAFEKTFSVGERKEKESVIRELDNNKLTYYPATGRTKNPPEWDVPMRTSDDLVLTLLSDTLHREVKSVAKRQPPLAKPVYSILTDSLYSILMQESDNFIAEQLLLMCADVVRDSLDTEIAIRYSTENYLTDLPDKPIWVDGSGLSRYNLFTPRTIVKMWQKILEIVPRERLFALVATGGKTGTLKNWFKNDQPYIFGKTGSLSNNHSLSGFIVTKKGSLLAFAFMNNNFGVPVSSIRRNMQDILSNIYQNY